MSPQPPTLPELSSTSLKLPGGSLPRDANFPLHISSTVACENLEVVRQTDSSSSSQVPVCPCSPPLHILASPLLAVFTSRPAPDATALPYGDSFTNAHMCIKSNSYDKLLILYHSWWFPFSNQTLTNTGTKPSTTRLIRAVTASTLVLPTWVFYFCFFPGT